jgi:CubicO group peptidase (beta-lactamase class C family)
MRFKKLIAASFVLASALLANAQVTIPDEFPSAQRVRDYVKAFNAGDDAMLAYLKANVSDAGLQRRSAADRLEVYKQIHDRLKTLEIKEVANIEVSGKELSLAVVMHSIGGEDALITFNFDPDPPNKLLSLQVEDAPRVGGPQRAEANEPAIKISADEVAKKAAAYFDDAAKKDEFSGDVLLAHAGNIIFQKAYGLADKPKKIANNMDTRFNLGSINKIFTKVCIYQLVSQGKLSLDDTLGKVLPDYPNADAREKVTIRQLLNMRSGIGDFFGEKFQQTPKSKIKSLADYLPLFADQPLQFEPGTGQRYSNGGFIVLGLIIEKVSGQDYYSYVKENVFKPAGMNDTDFYFSSADVPNRADGYTKEGSSGGWRNNDFTRPERGSSAGGGYSTAGDLLRFTKALLDKKLIMLDESTGKPMLVGFGIAGGSPGTNAALEFQPKLGNVIIVLSNYDPPSAEKPAMQIGQWMRGI